ncbi:MAG: hypothetical protein KJO30_08130 [Boseongicola sp.]|nr:hypothetical protein [Boseongicola sp.]
MFVSMACRFTGSPVRPETATAPSPVAVPNQSKLPKKKREKVNEADEGNHQADQNADDQAKTFHIPPNSAAICFLKLGRQPLRADFAPEIALTSRCLAGSLCHQQ